MAFYVWCEIVCRKCAETTSGQHTSGPVPRKEMKKYAIDGGWVLVDKEWFCRYCAKEGK